MSPLDFKTISELKKSAKQILMDVQQTGKQVAITLNGKPIAIVIPVPKEGFSMIDQKKEDNIMKLYDVEYGKDLSLKSEEFESKSAAEDFASTMAKKHEYVGVSARSDRRNYIVYNDGKLKKIKKVIY